MGQLSDLTPPIWDGRVDLFFGTGCWPCFGWGNFRFNTSRYGMERVDLLWGLDAGLASGGATLDLTPSYGDGRVDLF